MCIDGNICLLIFGCMWNMVAHGVHMWIHMWIIMQLVVNTFLHLRPKPFFPRKAFSVRVFTSRTRDHRIRHGREICVPTHTSYWTFVRIRVGSGEFTHSVLTIPFDPATHHPRLKDNGGWYRVQPIETHWTRPTFWTRPTPTELVPLFEPSYSTELAPLKLSVSTELVPLFVCLNLGRNTELVPLVQSHGIPL